MIRSALFAAEAFKGLCPALRDADLPLIEDAAENKHGNAHRPLEIDRGRERRLDRRDEHPEQEENVSAAHCDDGAALLDQLRAVKHRHDQNEERRRDAENGEEGADEGLDRERRKDRDRGQDHENDPGGGLLLLLRASTLLLSERCQNVKFDELDGSEQQRDAGGDDDRPESRKTDAGEHGVERHQDRGHCLRGRRFRIKRAADQTEDRADRRDGQKRQPAAEDAPFCDLRGFRGERQHGVGLGADAVARLGDHQAQRVSNADAAGQGPPASAMLRCLRDVRHRGVDGGPAAVVRDRDHRAEDEREENDDHIDHIGKARTEQTAEEADQQERRRSDEHAHLHGDDTGEHAGEERAAGIILERADAQNDKELAEAEQEARDAAAVIVQHFRGGIVAEDAQALRAQQCKDHNAEHARPAVPDAGEAARHRELRRPRRAGAADHVSSHHKEDQIEREVLAAHKEAGLFASCRLFRLSFFRPSTGAEQ